MKADENQIEIFFDDLTEEAQKEFLSAMGMRTSDEGNYDIFPIAVVPIPEKSDIDESNGI